MLLGDLPVLHFAKSELNTLMWYDYFEQLATMFGCERKIPTCIYEIKPLNQILSGRCKDERRLYQYGANKIEFIQKTPINQIAQDAINEYNKTGFIKRIACGRKTAQTIELYKEFIRDFEFR